MTVVKELTYNTYSVLWAGEGGRDQRAGGEGEGRGKGEGWVG